MNVEKLHTPDRIKYEIYEAIKEALQRCASVEDLADEIFDRNHIRLDLIHRGNDPAKEVQGVTFIKNGITFKGSQIDRKFSYGGLVKTIEEENRKREQERQKLPPLTESEGELLKFICGEKYDPVKLSQEHRDQIAEGERKNRKTAIPAVEVKRPITPVRQNAVEIVRPAVPERPKIDRIENYCLSPEEQKRLYSSEGLTLIRTMKDERQRIRFNVGHDDKDHDILVECLLETEKINRNPAICGVQLTDEQVEQVKDGQFLYMDNLKDKEGRTVAKYVVADDQLKKYWLFDKRPDQRVKYGHYEMRVMDKLLIEKGYIAHAVVKWWGGMGQTARPYLWKEKPSDTEYMEAWDDPRKPQQTKKPAQCDGFIMPKKKRGRGV